MSLLKYYGNILRIIVILSKVAPNSGTVSVNLGKIRSIYFLLDDIVT